MAKRAGAAALQLLTAREVHVAPEGDHGDGGGLLLRVGPTSSSWVYRYTAPSGKRREMGLGGAARTSQKTAGESLTAARRLAHEARELLRIGVDPLDDRDRKRAEAEEAAHAKAAAKARERWTLCRCARDYHERVIEPTRTDKHAAQWISSLENHIPPAIWHKPIADIEAPELLQAIMAIKPHERARNLRGDSLPETRMRVRQRLDAVFEDAIFHGRCTANPAAAIRRKMREEAPRKAKGQFAALPYADAPALMARLRNAPGVAARCLELAMLTAARTGEVLGAAWAEFDLDVGVWTIPGERMKAGEPHTVYLPPRALELLHALVGVDGVIVFPSQDKRRRGLPMSNMAMLKVLERLGVRDRTTVHGLCRATFSTWAYETAAARPDVIEACLAHRETDRIKAAYNRAEFAAERRALLEAWSGYLTRPTLALVAA